MYQEVLDDNPSEALLGESTYNGVFKNYQNELYQQISTRTISTTKSNHQSGSKNKKNLLQRIINQSSILSFICIILLLIDLGHIIYALICDLFNIPVLGFSILQPISFLLFCIFHSWLNLGLIPSISLFMISCFIYYFTELFSSYTGFPFGYISYCPNCFSFETFSHTAFLVQSTSEQSGFNLWNIFTIPISVPLSYFFYMYPAFVITECMVHGTQRGFVSFFLVF